MRTQKRDAMDLRTIGVSNDFFRCTLTLGPSLSLMTSTQSCADSQTLPKKMPHFSSIRVAGSMAYVSGQMAFAEGFTLVSGGVVEQTHQCIRNIETALSTAGLSLDNVVKTTVWLSRTEDFTAFNAAYAQALGDRTPPSRSTVRADLMVPGALVEIEAIALVP